MSATTTPRDIHCSVVTTGSRAPHMSVVTPRVTCSKVVTPDELLFPYGISEEPVNDWECSSLRVRSISFIIACALKRVRCRLARVRKRIVRKLVRNFGNRRNFRTGRVGRCKIPMKALVLSMSCLGVRLSRSRLALRLVKV